MQGLNLLRRFDVVIGSHFKEEGRPQCGANLQFQGFFAAVGTS